MTSSLNTAVTAGAALCAVIGLVLLAARVARWLGFGRPAAPRLRTQARLAPQASLPLDRVRTIHIVRCDGRDLALLTGGPADLLLGWLPGAPGDGPSGAQGDTRAAVAGHGA